MTKLKVISVVGVVLSFVALLASIFELFFCLKYLGSMIFIPILLIVAMLVILIANAVNLFKVFDHNKNDSKSKE